MWDRPNVHALMHSKHGSQQQGGFKAFCYKPLRSLIWHLLVSHAGMPDTAYTPAPLQAGQASYISSSGLLTPYSSAAADARSAVTEIECRNAQTDLEVRHCCLAAHVSHFEAFGGVV